MADLERVKVWGVEKLKKDDLNAEFDNIVGYVNTLVEAKMAAGPTITNPTISGTVSGGVFSNMKLDQQVMVGSGSATLGNHTILCTASGITVTLPTTMLTTDGYRITIKDIAGTAGTTPITIQAQASQHIDGNTSVQIVEDHGKMTLEGYNSEWWIVE